MATVALRLAARCAMTLARLTRLAGWLGRGLLLAEFFRNLLGAGLAKAHLDRAAVLEAERAVNCRVPLDALERAQHLTVQGVHAGRHRHDVRLGLGKGRRQLDLQVQRGGRCQRHHALAQRLADLVALFAGQRRGCRGGCRRCSIRSGGGCRSLSVGVGLGAACFFNRSRGRVGSRRLDGTVGRVCRGGFCGTRRAVSLGGRGFGGGGLGTPVGFRRGALRRGSGALGLVQQAAGHAFGLLQQCLQAELQFGRAILLALEGGLELLAFRHQSGLVALQEGKADVAGQLREAADAMIDHHQCSGDPGVQLLGLRGQRQRGRHVGSRLLFGRRWRVRRGGLGRCGRGVRDRGRGRCFGAHDGALAGKKVGLFGIVLQICVLRRIDGAGALPLGHSSCRIQGRKRASLSRKKQTESGAAGRHPSVRRRSVHCRRVHPDRNPPQGAGRAGTDRCHRRCPLRGAALAHPAHGRGAGAGSEAGRGRRVLHWHQPDRPGRRSQAWRARVQRTVLQHAQRGRAGAGRDHHADARHPAEERTAAPGRLDEERCQLVRGAWQDAGHHRLWPYRYPAGPAGRDPGHARGVLRHRDQAAAGQCTPALHAGRAAGRGRRGEPARARDAGHEEHDGCRADRPHEEGQLPHQCLARHRGRHRRAGCGPGVEAHPGCRHRRVPGRAQG